MFEEEYLVHEKATKRGKSMGYNLELIYSGDNKVEIYFTDDYEIQTGIVRNAEGKNGKGN